MRPNQRADVIVTGTLVFKHEIACLGKAGHGMSSVRTRQTEDYGHGFGTSGVCGKPREGIALIPDEYQPPATANPHEAIANRLTGVGTAGWAGAQKSFLNANFHYLGHESLLAVKVQRTHYWRSPKWMGEIKKSELINLVRCVGLPLGCL